MRKRSKSAKRTRATAQRGRTLNVALVPTRRKAAKRRPREERDLERAMRAVAGPSGSRPAGGRFGGAGRLLQARFDAAQTTDDNRRHWGMADGLSADAAASPAIRAILRNRARYEVHNNSYARGMTETLANDAIGTGPRLQMLTSSAEANSIIEREFMRWAQTVRLAEKLRTMRKARVHDGEAFSLLIDNPSLRTPVTLDLRLIEADQVTGTDLLVADDKSVDGIRFDAFGNPVEYSVLVNHPGGTTFTASPWAVEKIPAAAMIHWFRPTRPGQHRGIPEITPALPLFAQLRRYTLAVLDAAETAADFAAVLYTEAPVDGEAAKTMPMETLELERRMMTTLPEGWKIGQTKAEQPTTTYKEFKDEILNEVARCMNMPFNIAAGNSSGYNYASGRLDHQTYFKSIRVDQADCGAVVLDAVLWAWLAEAILISGYLPLVVRTMADPSHQWFWDGFEHVDPLKEATAQDTRLKNHTTTLAHEFARQGKDWEAELRQRAKELALMKELGLPLETKQPVGAPAVDPYADEEDDDASAE